MNANDLDRRSALAALGSTGLLAIATGASAADLSGRTSLEHVVEALRAAMVAGDGAVLDALLHERLNYMHSSGKSQTKQDLLAELAGKRFFAAFVHSGVEIDIVNEVGVVKLTADQVKNLSGGGTRPSRIVVLHTWLRTGNAWQLLTRASALLSGPSPASSAG